MIYSNSGSSAGVGFAVPVDTIKRIVPQLIKHGKVTQPGLGVRPLERAYYDYFGIETGLAIKAVQPGSPAAKAGLQGIKRSKKNGRYHLGDVIIAIDDKSIKNFDDIYNVLGSYKVGDTVKVTVLRGGKKKELRIKLIKVNG